MSRYIDSRHLESQFDEDTLYNGQEVLEVINEEPTADVKSVVHGKWIPIIERDDYCDYEQEWYECNRCHVTQYDKYNFCPSCGADMREEDK
jgi:transcription initiation factor IIE alpha subunit